MIGFNSLRLFILSFFAVFTIAINAEAFEITENDLKGSEKYNFYNEKEDKNEERIGKEYKDFSKIGFEDYSQKNIWRKFYVGIDINWYLSRIGNVHGYAAEQHMYNVGNAHKKVFYTNFFKRFQNLDIYGGMRVFKYFGTELGYAHFGNFTAKDGKKRNLDGAYLSAILYSPMLDLKYTSIEGYLSAGGEMLFGSANNGKPEFGGRFGTGLIFQIYGSIAFNIGVDYHYRFKSFSEHGFIAVKTGVNVYLNI